jgi:tape measure domain-containing protein
VASEVLRIRIRADSGNTAAVFNDISRNILGMTVGAAGARSGMMGLGAALSGAQITGRLAAAMFGAAAYGVYSMGSAMIQAAGAQDQFRVSMTALLKDTAKVDSVTSAVKRFADATSFSNEAVFQVAQNLVAAKVPLNNLIPTLQMLGDVSLGNAEKFSGIATAWYQIIAKGKLTAEEINQIAERGVSVWSILAEETGKSVPELQKLAETGKLTVDAYMPILQRGLAKNYAGSLKEASNLSTNLLVNITKSITNFAAAIGAGLGDTVNPFLQFLAQAFQRAALYAKALTQSAIWARFTQSLQAAAEALAPIIKGIGVAGFIGLIRVVQILTPLMYFFAAALRGIAFAAVQAMQFLKPLQDTFTRIATRIKQLDWQGLWTSIKTQSSDIGKKIGTLLLETISIAWDEFRKNLAPELSTLAKEILDGIGKAIADHPKEVFTAAVIAWFLAGMRGLPEGISGQLNWGTIIAGMFATADIQTGIESMDFGLVAQGVATAIAAGFLNVRLGPAAALLGALLLRTVVQDVRQSFAEKDWPGFWSDILAIIGAGIALASGAPLVAGLALALGPGFVEEVFLKIKEDIQKYDFGSLELLIFGVISGVFATVFLGLPAAIGAAVGTVVGLIALRITRGLQGLLTGQGIDWRELFSGVLALVIGGLLLVFTGLPVIVVAGIAGALVVFGPAIYDALAAGFTWSMEKIQGYWQSLTERAKTWMKAGVIAWVGEAISIGLLAAVGVISLPMAGLAAIGAAIVTGLILGLQYFQPNIFQWIADFFRAFMETIKRYYGIESPSTVMAEVGQSIVDGLYLGLVDGLAAGWDSMTASFQKWVDDVGIWFEDWKTKVFTVAMYALFSAQGLIDAIGTGFQQTWDMAKLAVQSTLDGVITWFRSWATGEGGFATKLLEFFSQPDSMTKGIEAMWNGAKSLVSSTLDSIIEYFRSWTTGDFAKKLQDYFGADVISNAIKNGLKAAWEGAKSVLGGFVTDAKNAVSNAFSGMTGGGGGGGGGGAGGGTTDQWGTYNYKVNTEGQDAADRWRASQGFAMGGSFRVGGSGGTDSQLVQFRASPNETVTIRRPDQGGGGMVIQNLNVYADSYQGGQDAARAIRDALGGQRKMLFATT